MEKKYQLIQEKQIIKLSDGTERTVYKIQAIRDFGNVKAGELGGFVETEDNLSHEGNCWVYDNAKVVDQARVMDNANVKDKATVKNKAVVRDEAVVGGEATVENWAVVRDNAKVWGTALVAMKAEIKEYACVKDEAFVFENAVVSGEAIISGDATVKGNAKVMGEAEVSGFAMIRDSVILKGKAEINNSIKLSGEGVVDEKKKNKLQTNMDVQERIGIKIAKIRNKRGLSIRQLADKSGVMFGNIGKLERGEYNVSIGILDKVCDALDIRIELTDICK